MIMARAKRDALLLPAGKLANGATSEAGELSHLQRLRHPPLDLVARQAPDLEAVGDVLGDSHMRKQRVVLEDHAHVARARRKIRDVAVVDEEASSVGAR